VAFHRNAGEWRSSERRSKEGTMIVRVLLVAAGFLLATSAQAVCYKDNKPYPTGAVVDGYVCQADGTWKKKV
jgi:hypothetical protein